MRCDENTIDKCNSREQQFPPPINNEGTYRLRVPSCLVLCAAIVVLSLSVMGTLLVEQLITRYAVSNNAKTVTIQTGRVGDRGGDEKVAIESKLPTLSPSKQHMFVTALPTLSEFDSKLMKVILNISGTAVLADGTPQHKAADWIIHHDTFIASNINPDDDTFEKIFTPRYVMSLLYYSMNGLNWHNATQYLGEKSVCAWYGVTCSWSEDIIQIKMPMNNMAHSIPQEISEMTTLEVLDLAGNFIEGWLPSKVGRLENLQFLDLASNDLNGTLPPSLCDLSNLQYLHLYENSIKGTLPTDIGRMVNLIELHLFQNEMGGSLPSEIGYLTELDDLQLHDNEFSGPIPSQISNVLSLRRLYLDGNILSKAIPNSLWKLQNLEFVDLFDNLLTGSLSSSIGNLTNLVGFDLHANRLTGTLPSIVESLVYLEELNLSTNKFTGSLPQALFGLETLSTLKLAGNEFFGTLSERVGDLNSLVDLDLSDNEFSGPIPSEIGNAVGLTAINFRQNNFSGSVPIAICDLDKAVIFVDCEGDKSKVTCNCCTSCP